MLNPYNIIITPYLTEKTMRHTMFGHHAFKVNAKARKPAIKRAVEQIFNVKVQRVCTVNVVSKRVSFRGRAGYCSGFKKATVILQEGSQIDLDNFK